MGFQELKADCSQGGGQDAKECLIFGVAFLLFWTARFLGDFVSVSWTPVVMDVREQLVSLLLHASSAVVDSTFLSPLISRDSRNTLLPCHPHVTLAGQVCERVLSCSPLCRYPPLAICTRG